MKMSEGGHNPTQSAPPLSLHPPPPTSPPSQSPPLCPLNVRVKWADHLNGGWLMESTQSIVLRETMLPLYDRLTHNKVSCHHISLPILTKRAGR